MKSCFWTGYSSNNEYFISSTIIPLINSIGDVLNINRFSDLAMGLVIEIRSDKIDDLFQSLSGHMLISGFDKKENLTGETVYVFLNITFIDATGDVRITVPDVPG